MRDKVAQRERTEIITGGARTFNEFVKEKALASNITPACVRSLPEIKEEWKQLKEKEKAEKKAEKTATKEAKKAEKKAEQQAKKATAKSDTAVAKEKTAIKKVAKKSAVDTENIKMVLVEKANASVPPAEPKVKGRPKKYATAEEARRAKIEATKLLNKAKKASLPPKPPKAVKPQKQGKKPKEPEITAEQIRRENEEEAKRVLKQKKKAYAREMKRRGEVEQMGMQDVDASEKWNPLVHEIELKAEKAKTIKEIDEVLTLIKQATQPSIYNTLDAVNIRSLDHSIDTYSKKKQAWFEHQQQAEKNIAMFKNAKENRKPPSQSTGMREAMKARIQKEAEAEEREYQERLEKEKSGSREIDDLHEEIVDLLAYKIDDEDAPRGTTVKKIEDLDLNKLAFGDYSPLDKEYLLAEWAQYHAGHLLLRLRKLLKKNEKKGGMERVRQMASDACDAITGCLSTDRNKVYTVQNVPVNFGSVYPDPASNAPVDPGVSRMPRRRPNRVAPTTTGRGLNMDDLKEFNNYGKIQDHLGQHLNDLKEAIDPKDLRDYIYFTREKARLKSKLVGGLVRMIGGGDSSDSDSGSDSDSDMEGGGDFFGNIGNAFKASWNRQPQSKAERDVLDFTLNHAEPALLAPLNVLAPPVAKIGDAQRKLLKSQYNV